MAHPLVPSVRHLSEAAETPPVKIPHGVGHAATLPGLEKESKPVQADASMPRSDDCFKIVDSKRLTGQTTSSTSDNCTSGQGKWLAQQVCGSAGQYHPN